MAEFTDERTITQKSSDPLKVQHGEESQQQQGWPKPSAPAFHTKETPVAGDQRHDEHEQEVPQPQKKSMLRRVKDRAKTLIQKHGYGHGNDHVEEEDQHQSEEEEGHDNIEQEEKEDTRGEKKEKAEDLNSNFSSRSSDAGSAVSPGLDASSARNLSDDAKAAKDREVTNTGIQWTPRQPNVVAEAFEPSTASDRLPSPGEIDREQRELPTTPGQPSAGVNPTLVSTEATGTHLPEDNVQRDSKSDGYMTHQVPDIAITDTADLATHPVQSQFSQELPNAVPYNRRNEALENEYYGKDGPEKPDYSDRFARSPRDPEGMMKSITEEPAVETVPIQQAAEDRWFDANDVVAGAPPTGKDQNPTLSHLGPEKFGTTEPIEDELEYTDQDKLGSSTETKMPHAAVSDESQDLKALQEASSEKFDENTDRSAALEVATSIEGSKDTTAMDLGDTDLTSAENSANVASKTGIAQHQSVDEVPYEPDRMADVPSTENSANVASKTGIAQHQSVDEVPYELDRMADVPSTENSANVASKTGIAQHQSVDEVPYEPDRMADVPSTENSANVASKAGIAQHQSVDEAPYEPDRMADEDNYENREEGKSYGDPVYDIDSAEKNVIPSKLEHGEHQEPEQEETEQRTERPSADEEEGAHEKSGEILTDTPSAAQSIVSSNPAVEEKAEGKTMERYEDPVDEQTKSESMVSSNPAVEEEAEGKTLGRSENDIDEKAKSESMVSSKPAVEEKAEEKTMGRPEAEAEADVDEQTKPDGPVAAKSYAGQMYTTAGTAKSALYSAFGYGGAKTVQDK